MGKNIKEISRENFTSESNTNDAIRLGCMQRLAESLEKIALDKVNLEKQIEWLNVQNRQLVETIENRDNTIRSLRGVITKLKKKLK